MRICVSQKALILYLLTGLLIVLSDVSHATTPPVLPYSNRHRFATGVPNRLPRDHRILPRDLENYIGQLLLTASFLDSMQEHNEDSNEYGGLHEGEGDQLWAIVETDNTQEAIRAWCEYALFFEDPDTYRDNVTAAWVYAENYPAWEESHPDSMYALHNCGWGLIAEIRYRLLYGDDKREYGLQCAEHLVEHSPRVEPDDAHPILPLVAGWAAGTLYDYGLLEENAEYLNAAIDLGTHVKEWIQHDPDRLNSHEEWALCGGTAMWGVLRSLGRSDSAETAEWAAGVLDEMDVFAGVGGWNNSWNIWYAHAWTEAFKLTADDEYRENAIAVVDSLVRQDTDRDGGVQARTGDPDNRDQSWVSAYTAWMGLVNLFDALEPVDVEMIALVNPSLSRPWPTGEPVGMVFSLVKGGHLENADIPMHLRGPMNLDTVIAVNGWLPVQWQVSRSWIPEEAGDFPFTAYADCEDEFDRSNDSLDFTINILPVGDISLSTLTISGDAVHSTFLFYNHEIDPDLIFKSFSTDPDNGQANGQIMTGDYRVVVIPDFPYATQYIDNIEITEENENSINLELAHPAVLLVDRDLDSTHADYYTDALDRRGFSFYHWRADAKGEIGNSAGGFQTVVYFTGDRFEETIPPADQDEIRLVLGAGRNVFVTGQYIADELQGTQFLTDVLKCQHLANDISMAMVDGVPGDEVFDDMAMLLLGARGANNQVAPSGIWSTGTGQVCATYRNKPDTAGAVRWEEENGARGMFFSFGFEGISEQAGNTRAEIMTAVLDWMNTARGISTESYPNLPQPMLAGVAFPNPANGMVRLQFSADLPSGTSVIIYDSFGRQISSLTPLNNTGISWHGMDINGRRIPSGRYYFQVKNVKGDPVSTAVPVLIIR